MKEAIGERVLDGEFLQETAKRARQSFESGEAYQDKSVKEYVESLPNMPDPQFHLEWFSKIFPKGNCEITTVYLQSQLKTGEIINGSYLLENGQLEDHSFLKVGEEIIDITADQFGGPTIYVGPLTFPWYPTRKL
jgi:hypothetical protein